MLSALEFWSASNRNTIGSKRKGKRKNREMTTLALKLLFSKNRFIRFSNDRHLDASKTETENPFCCPLSIDCPHIPTSNDSSVVAIDSRDKKGQRLDNLRRL